MRRLTMASSASGFCPEASGFRAKIELISRAGSVRFLFDPARSCTKERDRNREERFTMYGFCLGQRVIVWTGDKFDGRSGSIESFDDGLGWVEVRLDGEEGLASFRPTELRPEHGMVRSKLLFDNRSATVGGVRAWEGAFGEERSRHLENEINAAVRTISECPYAGAEARTYVLGVLQGMLAGVAGISVTNPRLDCSPSCLDARSTEAVRRLIAVMIDKA